MADETLPIEFPVPESIETPEPRLKAIVFPAPAMVPPMVLPAADKLTVMPSPSLLSTVVPLASVPIRLPCTWFFVAPATKIRMPEPPLPEIRFP